MSRALGVDYGQRRIGLALSDRDRLIAQAYHTLPHRGDFLPVIKDLCRIIDQEEVGQIVLGWPLRLNGKEGLQTRKVSRFMEALSTHISVPIAQWDERLSTTAAERSLIEAHVGRTHRKEHVDQVAACFILQGWLDAQRQTEALHPK